MDGNELIATPEAQALRVPISRVEARTRHLHFDLSFLGAEAQEAEYSIWAFRKRWPMRPHGPGSRAAAGVDSLEHPPTHYAEVLDTGGSDIQLALVYGAKGGAEFAPLVSAAIVTASGSPGGAPAVYGTMELAKALTFVHPQVTVLTSDAAGTVLDAIGDTSSVLQLQANIEALKGAWNSAVPILDDGKPVKGKSGNPLCTYELDPTVLSAMVPTATDTKAVIYSDPSLSGVRWTMQPGTSFLVVPGSASNGAEADVGSGYSWDLQDGGPDYGVSCAVDSLDENFNLTVTITNGFMRHMGVYAAFMEGDGTTPMAFSYDDWLTLLGTVTQGTVESWSGALGDETQGFLENDGNTLHFLGTVGSENTFLGVPVDATSSDFTFQIPQDYGPVGKVCIIVGSLGAASSGNQFDPDAAWVGIGATVVLDLAIPTYSLIAMVGEESDALFNKLFKDVGFIATVAFDVYTIAKDLFTGSSSLGSDVSSILVSLTDQVVQKVLTSAEVVGMLAGYFAAEEAEEAIPVVGWAMKVIAMEASAEQLAQTIGEVIGSPRVVEFDLTVTMDAQITLVPKQEGQAQAEFPLTATSYRITAEYSDGTSRVFDGAIADANVSQIVATWDSIPVGGTVKFTVALFSAEGWVVGKGKSHTMPNLVTAGEGQLVVQIEIHQHLYPISAQTTFDHNQLLTVTDGAYAWEDTTQAPTETAESLQSGQGNAWLEAVTGITINEDKGILGYVWEATGLGIPPVGGGPASDVEMYAFKNVAYGPDPDAGVMNVPAGYDQGPQLVYLRSMGDAAGASTTPVCLFLDPTGTAAGGYQLRQIVPVIDPAVALDSTTRDFDLATGNSWGRFPLLPTSMTMHASGVVVAVNPANPTLQILQLPAAAATDTTAPWALVAAGPGTREGLLDTPTLVTITLDQTILVLEAGANQRIQAFSAGGHPVSYFGGSTPYWIPLTSHGVASSQVTYLAMSADVQSYVYVLCMTGDGYDADQYYLDVYTPGGALLFTQQGLVGASATVDLWRNLYTLNFQQITGADGRTEPSVSQWIPSTPKTAGN